MELSPSADRPRRLHPVSPLFRALGYVRQFIVPVIVALFASGDYREAVFAIFAIPLALHEVLHYFRTTYQLTAEQLVVRRGIIFRTERHIPLDQIQNVDLTENLLHRLFHVAEVRVETASGAEPEAILRVVGLAEIDKIRERIHAAHAKHSDATSTTADVSPSPDGGPAPVAPSPGGRTAVEILHLSLVDLVKLGLITFRGLVVVAVVMGAVFQFDIAERVLKNMENWTAFSIPTGGVALVALIAGVLLFGLVGVTILSVLWAVVTLYDFRLVRVGEDLRVTCGLFTRLSATIPRPRIQFVSVRQSPLHRWFGTFSVSVETAGGSGEADNAPLSRLWIVPLAPEGRLPDLLREIQPEFELFAGTWQGLSGAGRRRMIRKAAIVSGLIMAAVVAMLFLWALPPLLLAGQPTTSFVLWLVPGVVAVVWLLAVMHARAAARAIGFAQTARGVAFRSGYWTRRTSATNYDRIQVVGLNESPFDRRWRMATFTVDTAGAGAAGHRIQIPCLERPVAEQLHRDTVVRTEATEFSWHR